MSRTGGAPDPDEPDPSDAPHAEGAATASTPSHANVGNVDTPAVPRPVNWNLLTAKEAATEWLELDRWVKWLRDDYALGPAVVPPFWHRHKMLVWELSTARTSWLSAVHPKQDGFAGSRWHSDFAELRQRLRDWVSEIGTRVDRDRSDRFTQWPGESTVAPVVETLIANRDADFAAWVKADLARRLRAEEKFKAAHDADLARIRDGEAV